jgi:hypothetical protein
MDTYPSLGMHAVAIYRLSLQHTLSIFWTLFFVIYSNPALIANAGTAYLQPSTFSKIVPTSILGFSLSKCMTGLS